MSAEVHVPYEIIGEIMFGKTEDLAIEEHARVAMSVVSETSSPEHLRDVILYLDEHVQDPGLHAECVLGVVRCGVSAMQVMVDKAHTEKSSKPRGFHANFRNVFSVTDQAVFEIEDELTTFKEYDEAYKAVAEIQAIWRKMHDRLLLSPRSEELEGVEWSNLERSHLAERLIDGMLESVDTSKDESNQYLPAIARLYVDQARMVSRGYVNLDQNGHIEETKQRMLSKALHAFALSMREGNELDMHALSFALEVFMVSEFGEVSADALRMVCMIIDANTALEPVVIPVKRSKLFRKIFEVHTVDAGTELLQETIDQLIKDRQVCFNLLLNNPEMIVFLWNQMKLSGDGDIYYSMVKDSICSKLFYFDNASGRLRLRISELSSVHKALNQLETISADVARQTRKFIAVQLLSSA